MVKGGKVSLDKLLSEWRDRFEKNADKATREVLELVVQVQETAAMVAAALWREVTFCKCCL